MCVVLAATRDYSSQQLQLTTVAILDLD